MSKELMIKLINFSRTLNYTVFICDLPGKVKEAVVPNLDNHFTIAISNRLSDDERHKAFLHAIYHIYMDDFNSDKDADEIENKAHNI